jgi:3-oxoacyl-[acyl-carrier protein] reductase
MSLSLQDRVCLVTGAAQGIGAAVARGFLARGATVIAADIRPPEIEGVLNLIWDVTDPDRAGTVVAEIVDRFGRLDALVANAGTYPRDKWDEITPERWRQILQINLDGAWYACQAAAKPMTSASYGKIVTVSSIEVRLGVPVHAHYDAAKAGVIGLTRSLARALGPRGVRVNCLMPGAVLTEGELRQFPDQEDAKRFCGERQCLPERLLPEAVEPAFAFLCSSESDAITGQVLNVDHGWIHY